MRLSILLGILGLFLVCNFEARALTIKSGESVDFSKGNGSSSGKIDLESRTKRLFGDAYFDEPITKIVVPDHWPFSNNADQVKKFLSAKMREAFPGDIEAAQKCSKIFTTKWKQPNEAGLQARQSCMWRFPQLFHRNRDISLHAETLLEVAKKDSVTGKVLRDDFSPDRYDAVSFVATNATFYSFHYDEFNYTVKERQIVDEYFSSKLKTLDIETVGNFSKRVVCDPKKQNRIGIKAEAREFDPNTCGSNRWKMAVGQLFFAIRSADQELLDLATYNIRFMLEVFDEEGIFVTWATRGALAWDYSHDVAPMLSMITEGYHALGFDFFQYKNRHGMSVKQLFDKQFEIVDDVSILEKYAKRQWATKGTSYQNWIKLSNQERTKGWPKEHLVYTSPRYIERYRPDLASLAPCENGPLDDDMQGITSFNTVDVKEIYLSNKNPQLCVEELLALDVGVSGRVIPKQLSNFGLTIDNEGRYALSDTQKFETGDFVLKDVKDRKENGFRYKVAFDGAWHPSKNFFFRGWVTFYVKQSEVHVAVSADKYFKQNPSADKEWARLIGHCGLVDEENEKNWIEVPIKKNWMELNEKFLCYIDEMNDEKLGDLFKFLVAVGSTMDPSTLKN